MWGRKIKILVFNLRVSLQLTDEAADLYKTLMTYKDFSYPKISSENVSSVNNVITLHVLNHVMRARSLVVANNRFLRDLDCEDDEDFDVDLYRDQSITRPSVLILTPFKNTAYNIFKTIEKLFVATEKKHVVVRKNRFKSEFGPQGEFVSFSHSFKTLIILPNQENLFRFVALLLEFSEHILRSRKKFSTTYAIVAFSLFSVKFSS